MHRFAVQVGSNLRVIPSASLVMRDWNNSDTLYIEMEAAIAEARMRFTTHNPGRYFLTGRCTVNTPAICNVAWDGGGGHAILCVGTAPGTTNVVILDPWYGLVEIPIANLPRYDFVDGGGGNVQGEFVNGGERQYLSR